MDSKNGGQTFDEKQRQAAAELARRKVLMSYEKQVEREENVAEKFIKAQEKSPQPRVLGTSTTPVFRTVSNEEWKKYHTAWQDYYQKYYSQYYLKAAKDYVAKEVMTESERLQKAGQTKQTEPIFSEKPSEVSSALQSSKKQGSEAKNAKNFQARFKARIQARALEKEKRERRKWLTPILAGMAVMATILFLQYNRLIFAPLAAYVSPGEAPTSEISAVDPTVTLTKVSGENKLIIPKLNVEVPIHFGVALDDVMAMMNSGVVHYRINGASAYPGEIGNFVITGHSAGDIYSANQYKFIFSGLERLEAGDIIYVHYNGVRYTYQMTRNEIIEPTEVSKLIYETDKPILTLVTCWPLGTSRYRLLVTAEQISPSASSAKVAENNVEVQTTEMPSSEPTLFERIWNWLTGKK